MVSLNGFKDKAPQTDDDSAEEGFEGLSEQSKVKTQESILSQIAEGVWFYNAD